MQRADFARAACRRPAGFRRPDLVHLYVRPGPGHPVQGAGGSARGRPGRPLAGERPDRPEQQGQCGHAVRALLLGHPGLRGCERNGRAGRYAPAPLRSPGPVGPDGFPGRDLHEGRFHPVGLRGIRSGGHREGIGLVRGADGARRREMGPFRRGEIGGAGGEPDPYLRRFPGKGRLCSRPGRCPLDDLVRQVRPDGEGGRCPGECRRPVPVRPPRESRGPGRDGQRDAVGFPGCDGHDRGLLGRAGTHRRAVLRHRGASGVHGRPRRGRSTAAGPYRLPDRLRRGPSAGGRPGEPAAKELPGTGSPDL